MNVSIGKDYRTRDDHVIRVTGVNYDSQLLTARVISAPSGSIYEVEEEIDYHLNGRYTSGNRTSSMDLQDCLNPDVVTSCRMLIEVPLASVDAILNTGVAVLEMRQ